MSAIFELDRFGELPLWAQVLIASRMVRRGALAMLEGAPASFGSLVFEVCDAIERCAERGEGVSRETSIPRGMKLREEATRDTQAIANALWSAIDATRAAEATQDFPVDATVTASARRAVAALAGDRRVNPLQLHILMAADFDLVRFACEEIGVQKYNGVTAHVLGRLAPVHALTLSEPSPTPEEEAR